MQIIIIILCCITYIVYAHRQDVLCTYFIIPTWAIHSPVIVCTVNYVPEHFKGLGTTEKVNKQVE